jgi:hypothetical protein
MSWFDQCQETFSTLFTALAPVTISTGSDTVTYWDTVLGGHRLSSQTVLASGRLSAEPVRVLWQSSDLSSFPSDYATSLDAMMGVKFGIESSLAATKGVNLGVKSTSSTGVRSGIAIGAALGFSLLVGPIALLILRRRRKARYPSDSERIAEMSDHPTSFKEFLRAKWKAEMDGSSQPAEIDSNNVYVVPGPPAELEASQHEQNKDPLMPEGIKSCTVAD